METKAKNTKDKSDIDKTKQKDKNEVDNGVLVDSDSVKAVNKAHRNIIKLHQQSLKKTAETPRKKPSEPKSFEEGQIVDGKRINLDIQMEVEHGDQLDGNEYIQSKPLKMKRTLNT